MDNPHLQNLIKTQVEDLLANETPDGESVEAFAASLGTLFQEQITLPDQPDQGELAPLGMLQLVLNNIPVRVFWKDVNGVFVGCNRHFAEDMGLSEPEDVIGENDMSFATTKGQAEVFRKVDREVMESGKPRYKIRESHEVEGEATRWLETNKVPLHDGSGKVIGILGTYENISDRVKHEERLSRANAELARAARMKDQFLAGMSHELRTPLNSILGLSEALQEQVYGEINERQQNAIKRVEEGGRHLLALINDILDIAKFEAGEVTLEIQPVGVRQVCESSLSFVREQAGKKNLKLDWSVDESIDFLFGDERRLKQILINLLSNSVKFTEQGSVELKVTCSPDRGTIFFCVEDSGIGIPDEKLCELFKPFRQVDSSLARAYDGAGLGLSLVKHMAELHGGSAAVESVVDEGSRFTVAIPWRTRFEEVTPSAELVSLELASPKKTKRRALVVEDCKESADQVSRYLEEFGYDVSVVDSGELALTTAASEVPDLIILDILLPGISGWTVLENLRVHRRTSEIPVLIISVMDERNNANLSSANGYLVKPIDRSIFRSKLEAAGLEIKEESETTSEESSATSCDRQAGGRPTVLLAEDNAENILTFTEYLEANGLDIIVASNGKQAIEMALSEQPELILMDVQMPVMDGLEAISEIRKDERIRDIPIIALTAMAMPGDRDRCIDVGATDYLAKPVRLSELLSTTLGYLQEGQARNHSQSNQSENDILSP